MSETHKQKLYCYVDETGQDTEGRLFLVSVVITEQEREEFARELEQIESEPGIRLADAFAGFLRDALEGAEYAQETYQEARKRGIVREV